MHLHYPHHGNSASSHTTRLQAFFSPPRQHQSTKNRAFFSIFYTVAVVFPHVVTLVYWLILVPHKQISRELPFACNFLYFVMALLLICANSWGLIRSRMVQAVLYSQQIWNQHLDCIDWGLYLELHQTPGSRLKLHKLSLTCWRFSTADIGTHCRP